MAGLTPKMEKFVDEYLIDLNATQAALRAGYSKKTAYRTGSENLQKPQIQALIAKRREEASKRAEVTLDDILNEYKKIAFGGMSKFVRLNENGEPEVDLSGCTLEDLDLLGETQIEAFTECEGTKQVRRVKIKMMDRLKALETLGKHLGLCDKAAEKAEANRVAQMNNFIAQMAMNGGSAAPVATAHLYANTPDDDKDED